MRALAAVLMLALGACQAVVADEGPARCASCHQAEFQSARGHVGKRPNTCGSCHTQEAWHPATDVVSGGSRREGEAEGMIPEVLDASAEPEDAALAIDASAPPKPKKKVPKTAPSVVPPVPTLDIPPSNASRRRGH